MSVPSPDSVPPPGSSTSVRFMLLRRGFGVLGRIAPELAAAAAERLFFTPPRPRRSRGDAVLGEARRFHVAHGGRRLAAWRWGRGPTVLLLHGWGGRAGQLTSFVPPLVGRGFSVLALDAPGHGLSGRGLSSAPEFARALRAVAEASGPIHGVVAHSLGAAATALAMREGLRVARAAFLAPAADPPAWVPPFAARLGIAPDVVERMRERSERRLRLRWEELRVPVLAASLEAALLVVHDRGDAEVPLRDGIAIAGAWPGARLVETSGLGHNRLLRDPEVVAEVTAFLAEGVGPACACGATVDAPETCERCRLEQELFDREARWAAVRRSPAA